MPECEFKGFCDYTSLTKRECLHAEPEECQMYRRFVRIFKSPQSKKQSEEKVRKAIDDFREELVEEMKKASKSLRNNYLRDIFDIIDIIRTHGKETE